MTRNDKTIVCKECGRTFIFRSDEQSFYAEQGYDDPIRCKDCRTAKKAAGPRQDRSEKPAWKGGGGTPGKGGFSSGHPQDRELFPATCAACGKSTMVPFKPREGGKPVYCRDCFNR